MRIYRQKLVNAIAEKKNPPLEKFILALGIRHVGAQTAIDLANKFGSMDKLQRARIEQLEDIDGIGKVVAESVVAWFADEDNSALLEKFERVGVHPHFQKKTGRLIGKSFVITGSLEYEPRSGG